MIEEPPTEKSQKKEAIAAVICLTDVKPIQCKDITRISEATADLLPNYTDLRFPYKGSSMLCSICGKPLAGDTKEEEPTKEEESQDKKGKTPKRKPRPWEIHVENLHHENENDHKTCPATQWQDNPNAHLMRLILAAHQITWIQAWKEKASRPEGTEEKREEVLLSLEEQGTLPKLVASINSMGEQSTEEQTLL